MFLAYLAFAFRKMVRAQAVFKECMSAIVNKNVLITIFTSMGISILRIMFILHVTEHVALLMSIVNPVTVRLQLLGEWHEVDRSAWSPFYLRGTFFYVFGTFWILEFMSFG